MTGLHYSLATSSDWQQIAALHALSWRATYRGLMRDEYLDHQADADLAALWQSKMANGIPVTMNILLALRNNQLQGFCGVQLDAHEELGTLIDAIHIHPDSKGQGLGLTLLGRSARWAANARPQAYVHLFVYARNRAARDFYRKRGGQEMFRQNGYTPCGQRSQQWIVMWRNADELAKECGA